MARKPAYDDTVAVSIGGGIVFVMIVVFIGYLVYRARRPKSHDHVPPRHTTTSRISNDYRRQSANSDIVPQY